MRVADLIHELSERERIGLVVQGGGMRGVYSMGALLALDDFGLRDAFDVAAGSSAGAINLAYFIAGQADEAVSVYVDHLSNRRFVNLRRLRRIVDIDYMIDVVLKGECPLDVRQVLSSRTELLVALTEATSGQTRYVTPGHGAELYEILRATAALPTLYDRQVAVGDEFFIDGGITALFPLECARARGCTNILGILTRSRGYRLGSHGRLNRLAVGLAFRRQTPSMRESVEDNTYAFNRAVTHMEHGRPDGGHRWGVWPSDDRLLVRRLTRDKKRLEQCAGLGYSDMQRFLSRQAGAITSVRRVISAGEHRSRTSSRWLHPRDVALPDTA